MGGRLFTLVSALALALASTNNSPLAKAPKPAGTLAGLFNADDYPAEALNRNEQGDVGVSIHIDSAGSVSDCVILKSSGSETLDKRTCDVIRERARFKPALDRKGRAVASEYHQTIHWLIANGPALSDPWTSRMVRTFGHFGDLLSCRIDLDGAARPAAGQPAPSCSADVRNVSVGFGRRFGAPVDKVTDVEQFSLGPLSAPQLGPGEILASREVLHLDIDAAGNLTSCKVVEQSDAHSAAASCPPIDKQYLPRKGADRKPAPFAATIAFSTIVHVDRSRPPEPEPVNGSLQGLFTSDDYPPQALDRGDQGQAGIVIRTDPKGLIKDCVVEESSGSSLLDKQTCDVLRQRAKFKPAQDMHGVAVAGEYRSRIAWKIEEDATPSDPWATRMVLNFAPDGRPLSCRLELEGAMAPAPGEKPGSCDNDAFRGAVPPTSDLPGAVVRLISEERFALASNPAPGLGPGDQLISRVVLGLDVDAAGKLTACNVVEQSGAATAGDPCAAVGKAFHPRNGADGKPASFHATIAYNLWIHVEKIA